MRRYYYTFSDEEGLPYKDSYIIIYAKNAFIAAEKIRKTYPGLRGITISHTDVYDEKRWNNYIKRWYKGEAPAEILLTEEIEEEMKMKKRYEEKHHALMKSIEYIKKNNPDIDVYEEIGIKPDDLIFVCS